uniref:VWFA domain-containing protein n=2 Tax=Kalanchoe fedtschenkoi TaxID=63787 RepID=A0A7N0UTK9_KALFE
MAEDFGKAVEDGLRLSKRIYFGKDRSVAPPKPPAMLKSAQAYLPTAPMVYAVISDPRIVDNPDIPSYQPHVHGRCDPPALIPLQMNQVAMEVYCYMDTAFVTVTGTWRVHCVMGSKSCSCRIAIPMGEEGSILGVDVEVPKRTFSTHLVAMVDEQELDNHKGVRYDEKGGFLKPHIFTLTVPQVDGGSNISIKASWSQKLLYQDGQYTLNIPFSFPEFVTPAGKKMPKREKIQLNVNTGTKTEVICKSTSHPLKERNREVGKLCFFYESDVLTWSSHNFIFSYDISSSHTFGTLLLQSPPIQDADQREMFCFQLYPGTLEKNKTFRKEVVFVADISGSMQGKPLDDTKSSLSAALSKLRIEDRFNVIAFNGEIFLYSSSMELATEEAIEKAIQWIGINFIAGGSTDILAPLIKAMDLLSDVSNSMPMIMLVTDGTVENEKYICETLKSRLKNQASLCPRIHTFGIGSFCNHYFLQMLAVLGRGCHDIAYDVESVEHRMERFFSNALSVILADISLVLTKANNPKQAQPSELKVVLLPHLGYGFGNLTATNDNTPCGCDEPKPPEAAEMFVMAASSCCGKMCEACCCMCCIQACSRINNQCGILLTQLVTSFACLGCISCCELCCSAQDGG